MITTAESTVEDLRGLHHRIDRVRRKRVTVMVTAGVALALTIFLASVTVESLLDWLVELPWLMRALILLGTLGVSGFFIRRDVIKPLRTQLNDDAIALVIERALPTFRTRYIASIQLARAEQQPSSLVRALLAQTESLAATLNFREVVKLEKMKRALLIAGAVMTAVIGLAWFGGSATPLLVKRAALFTVPLPRKTQIVSITGDRKIGVGEDLHIDVTATGVIPPRGTVVTTSAKGQTREFPLEAEPGQRGLFKTVIRSPQESFKYLVKLNDATSPSYRATTLLRPAVVQLTCQQIYPSYLKLKAVDRSPGDLKLLAGSHLKITVKASTGINRAWLRLVGPDKDAPLQIDPHKPQMLNGEIEIPPKDLTGFSVHMVDKAGIESGETATYRIDLVPDREPTIKITYPTRREELATPAATALIAFEAEDDFGLSKAMLHYTSGATPEKTITFDLGRQTGRRLNRRFEWKLPSLNPHPQIGDVLEYWVTVADTNVVSGPGAATTEHYQIKVVTQDEKRLEFANRFSDTLGGIGEVAGTQEELNKALGETIFAKPSDQP